MPLGHDEDDPRGPAMDALRELILAGESYRQAFAEYFSLGLTESAAISYLYARGAMGQSELAQSLGITTSTATTLIDRLETHGLAERVRETRDRRRISVRLTRRGREAVQHSRAWFRSTFDEVSDRELTRTTRILTSVASGLRSQAEAIAGEQRPAARASRRSPRRG